jgi:hypothetical protein
MMIGGWEVIAIAVSQPVVEFKDSLQSSVE